MNPLLLNSSDDYFDSPIIVALDYDNEPDVMNLITKLNPHLCKLKVGKELFTATGPKLIEKLVASGFKVFLDLKFHDIPNTVQKACTTASNLGIWMLNVHASGGAKMLESAKFGVENAQHKPLLIAVTVLTSMKQNDLTQTGINTNLSTHVINLAKLSYSAGLDGVVCSAQEAKLIKNVTSQDFLTITPGIRLVAPNLSNTTITNDDQNRIMTPALAIANLANYIVIGRPITLATDPYIALVNILSSIQ